jgi:hypothetical protein
LDERNRKFKTAHFERHGEVKEVPLRELTAASPTSGILYVRDYDLLLAEVDQLMLRHAECLRGSG